MAINPLQGISKAAGNVFNRTLGRLFGAGLNPGAESPISTSGQARWSVRNQQTDWRVKLTLPTGSPLESLFFKDVSGKNVLAPLADERGVVFPLTPSVILQHTATYNPMLMPHSNQPHFAYSNSESAGVTIVGEFPVQNYEDAQAWVATLHFLRSVTKMFFGGDESQFKGNPPPILHLKGYGDYVFKNVPVVVTSFNCELTQGVDYISTSQNTTEKNMAYDFDRVATSQKISASSDNIPDSWAPTSSNITVSLQPIYSRDSMKRFNMKDFVNGNLNGNDGIGFI